VKRESHHRGRCRVCGYRLHDAASTRCPECGSDQPALVPMSRDQWRQFIGGLARWVLYECMIAPVASALGIVAVALNSMELFILSAMFTMAGILAAVVLAMLVAVEYTAQAMHAWWSLRESEVGPWSRRSRKFAMWVLLLIAQLLPIAAASALALMMFPDYPAGWP
jgi:hypothetical protein